MQQLSTFDTTRPIDYDNLNIVIRPRPPRRRSSGISLVPFRPYVKCLTSVREPFSFADGKNEWRTMGRRETFFKQQNARCIGSSMDDCDISDVIQWDIEGESTRLPMVCKLWIIVDGAVVERGKPHLVQDAAIQVYTAGRNRRSILGTEQRYVQTPSSTSDRRRRHSWHDINEYYSVPYYQYSHSIHSGYQEGIQCNLDNEHKTSVQESLSFTIEETTNENQFNRLKKYNAREIIHNQSIPQNRVQISTMTQTEQQFINRSTEIKSDFIHLFNLNLQTNENLLSSIVNPYIRHYSSYYSSHTTTMFRNGIEYTSRGVSTGDDYPQWWVQLSTNVILSDHITDQGPETKKLLSIPSPRQLNQSIQRDNEYSLEIEIEKSRPSPSIQSPRIQKSSSTMTINDNYEIIDQINDGNNSRRIFPFYDQHQRIDSDSRLSDYQIDTSSNCEYCRLRRGTPSSKQSEPDYNTFTLALNQQLYSTPDLYHHSNNEINQRIRTKSSENTSGNILAVLLERYEKTLRERQRAITIVNDELLDINDVLNRYRPKIENSNRAIQLYQDITSLSSQSKEENPSSKLSLAHLTKTKYRTIPNPTSEEMLEGYIPSPRIDITDSRLNISRQRQPRFDYYDLYSTDYNTSSAWIRYNEQRIDELQKRIDLMLQIDDNDDNQLFFSSNTVTQRINDILLKRSKRRNQLNSYHNRILLPHRYNFRYPYRINQSLPTSSRLLTRNLIRSTKSVRISTDHDQTYLHKPLEINSQPIVSILRRQNKYLTSCSHRLVDSSHIWKNDSDGKVYILRQFSIPRYYRLYDDVSFREIYNFSRILQSFTNQTTPEIYSSVLKNFAVNQQLPIITSLA